MAKRSKRKRRNQATPTLPENPPERGLPECQVVGCPNLPLERHAGPGGIVWLCGRCGIVARRNLRDEATNQEILAELAKPLERAAALRQRQRERRGS